MILAIILTCLLPVAYFTGNAVGWGRGYRDAEIERRKNRPRPPRWENYGGSE